MWSTQRYRLRRATRFPPSSRHVESGPAVSCVPRAQKVRDAREIRMVPGVPKPMAPEDRVAFHQEQRRHRPGIAYRPAGHIPFQCRAESGHPDARPKHLRRAALPDPKGSVESLGGIGNGARLLPVTPEEFRTLGNRALVDEQERRIGGIGLADSA